MPYRITWYMFCLQRTEFHLLDLYRLGYEIQTFSLGV